MGDKKIPQANNLLAPSFPLTKLTSVMNIVPQSFLIDFGRKAKGVHGGNKSHLLNFQRRVMSPRLSNIPYRFLA